MFPSDMRELEAVPVVCARALRAAVHRRIVARQPQRRVVAPQPRPARHRLPALIQLRARADLHALRLTQRAGEHVCRDLERAQVRLARVEPVAQHKWKHVERGRRPEQCRYPQQLEQHSPRRGARKYTLYLLHSHSMQLLFIRTQESSILYSRYQYRSSNIPKLESDLGVAFDSLQVPIIRPVHIIHAQWKWKGVWQLVFELCQCLRFTIIRPRDVDGQDFDVLLRQIVQIDKDSLSDFKLIGDLVPSLRDLIDIDLLAAAAVVVVQGHLHDSRHEVVIVREDSNLICSLQSGRDTDVVTP